MTAWLLPAAVLAVAVLYASVGHAGATGYIAVMGLLGLAPEVIRPTALVLNLVVAAIGTVQFVRAGHFRRDLFVPLAAASVPAAALGGGLALPTAVFEGLLGLVLALSAMRILADVVGRNAADAGRLPGGDPAVMGRLSVPRLAAVGAGLGLASGLTGVGGGVFLTPLLLALGVATTRQVAAVSVVFILVNSAAGLGGWLAGGGSLAAIDPWVVAAAAGGGLVGSHLGAFKLPVRWLRLLMAVVLAVASVKLLGGIVAIGKSAVSARPWSGRIVDGHGRDMQRGHAHEFRTHHSELGDDRLTVGVDGVHADSEARCDLPRRHALADRSKTSSSRGRSVWTGSALVGVASPPSRRRTTAASSWATSVWSSTSRQVSRRAVVSAPADPVVRVGDIRLGLACAVGAARASPRRHPAAIDRS